MEEARTETETGKPRCFPRLCPVPEGFGRFVVVSGLEESDGAGRRVQLRRGVRLACRFWLGFERWLGFEALGSGSGCWLGFRRGLGCGRGFRFRRWRGFRFRRWLGFRRWRGFLLGRWLGFRIWRGVRRGRGFWFGSGLEFSRGFGRGRGFRFRRWLGFRRWRGFLFGRWLGVRARATGSELAWGLARAWVSGSGVGRFSRGCGSAGVGSDSGAGSGSGAGVGSCSGDGSGFGSGAGVGSGSGVGSSSAAGAGAGVGSGSGAGSGSGCWRGLWLGRWLGFRIWRGVWFGFGRRVGLGCKVRLRCGERFGRGARGACKVWLGWGGRVGGGGGEVEDGQVGSDGIGAGIGSRVDSLGADQGLDHHFVVDEREPLFEIVRHLFPGVAPQNIRRRAYGRTEAKEERKLAWARLAEERWAGERAWDVPHGGGPAPDDRILPETGGDARSSRTLRRRSVSERRASPFRSVNTP